MPLTLAAMSDFICKKVGKFDAFSQTLCKSYLDARYRLVWNSYYWLDSQVTITSVSLAIGVNTFAYPAGVERIVTIGIQGGDFLDPVDPTFLIESDPTIFTRSGTPDFYSEDATGPPGAYTVKVYPTPSAITNLVIIGKRACPGLSADTDASMLRNCDDAIIAFAHFDMLERERQYAKSQQKLQEATGLLEAAKSLEKDQANQPRKHKMLTVTGNSLSEMTDAVAGICNAWTPEMTILIQEFLRRNYQALYDLNLWPESIVQVNMPQSEQMVLPEFIDKLLGVRGMDGQPIQSAEPILILNVSPSMFDTIGKPVAYSILTPVGLSVLPGHEQLDCVSSSAADVGKKMFIHGESDGVELSEVLTLNGAATVSSANAYDVPLTVSKEHTTGDVSIFGHTTALLYEKLLAQEHERKHIRIWLLNPPADQTTEPTCDQIMLLGKRKIRPLVTNEDTPLITGCQQVLIAAAAADLFARLGNAQGAQDQRAKADASAKVLTGLHTDQSSYAPRFVPQVEARAFTRDLTWAW